MLHPARVVFIQPHLKFGGAESQTVGIVNGLAQRGVECTVILHRAHGGLLEKLDPRVRVIDLGFQSHAAVVLGSIRVRKVLSGLPSSLVVVRLWSSIMMVGSMTRFVRKHRYAFYEDLDPIDHTDFIKFGRLKRTIVRTIFRRHERELVANTQHVAMAMVKVYGLRKVPIVIPCGVDSAFVQSAAGIREQQSSLTPSEQPLRVVTVGSLIERKALGPIRDALMELKRPIIWTVVGEGPLDEWLREKATASGEVRIVLAGGTPNPFPIIAASDLMVHGAKSESFGVVLLEAIALGTPVAANGANGPREIANDLPGAAIEIFDVSSPRSLAVAITELQGRVEKDEVTTALGSYELEHCLESWERMAR